MKDLTIGLVQCNSVVGEKDKNLAATMQWVAKAKDKGADLVCFSELNITGHAGHPLMVSQAEPIPGGNSCRALMELASKLDIYVVAGICEEENGIPYNTQFIVGPEGFVGKQRKIHLSGDEYFQFRHGSKISLFVVGETKVGIIICYDNAFPEVSRCLAIQGAELLLCPYAGRFGDWPTSLEERKAEVRKQKEDWRIIHRARARDNGCYVAVYNAIGKGIKKVKGVKANHAGGCMVIDPGGEIINESQSEDISEEMIITELKEETRNRIIREKWIDNLKNRRIESFGILTQPTD